MRAEPPRGDREWEHRDREQVSGGQDGHLARSTLAILCALLALAVLINLHTLAALTHPPT
jgi:hypothetical protein